MTRRPKPSRTVPHAGDTPATQPAHTDILLIGDAAPWPLDQGRRIRGHHMLTALDRQGVRVRLASIEPAPADLPPHVRRLMIPWPDPDAHHLAMLARCWLGARGRWRRRMADYFGADMHQLAGTIALVEHLRPCAIVALGQNGLLLLHAAAAAHVDGPAPARIWYGADELVNFHLSCLRREPLRNWPARIRRLLEHAIWEQLFVRGLDGAIGVSPRDAALMKHLAGARRGICIRNGVDLTRFSPAPPGHAAPTPCSLAFWGRMDFEPNVDAMTWFVGDVWPQVRLRWPHASLTIAGKHPTDAVVALGREPGVTVTGAVDDIREVAWNAEVTILPMRCGGGIKNKLLEAAAMGRPIVATPHAVKGLHLPSGQVITLCDTPRQWVDTLRRLWSDAPHRHRLGAAGRQWVEKHHTWDGAARQLLDWTNSLRPADRGAPHTSDVAPTASSAADTTSPSRKAA